MDEQSAAFRRGKLVRESEWTRVYEAEFHGKKGMLHESKFLADGMEVSADSIVQRWGLFSDAEKRDFANAFACKREITDEDERILDFLMEAGDFPIWMAIASRLREHRDRDKALGFLLARIGEDHEHKANFYQALGLMGDKRAVPALRAAYDRYRERLGPRPVSGTLDDGIDYLSCCAALWDIEGLEDYKRFMVEALNSEDKSLHAIAEQALRETSR
jgi:HEAT repeat protein